CAVAGGMLRRRRVHKGLTSDIPQWESVALSLLKGVQHGAGFDLSTSSGQAKLSPSGGKYPSQAAHQVRGPGARFQDARASSSSVSIAIWALLCCSSGPSIKNVSSTRSPSVVTLASCRLMRW